MNAPDNLRYQQSHEWIGTDDGPVPVGITDHAQDELSDVVYVELPEVGATISKGDPVAVVESVKAASDIYTPVSGTITEVNTALEESPGLINSDPYGDGWIFKLEVNDREEFASLMGAATYSGQVG